MGQTRSEQEIHLCECGCEEQTRAAHRNNRERGWIKVGLMRAQQETVFRFDEEEQIVHIYSASPKTWRRLARLGLAPHKETTRDGKPSGRFYSLPISRFRWGLKGKGRGNAEALRKVRNSRSQSRPDAAVGA